MESLKTAVVVTILLVVGYVVYQQVQNNAGPLPPRGGAEGFAGGDKSPRPADAPAFDRRIADKKQESPGGFPARRSPLDEEAPRVAQHSPLRSEDDRFASRNSHPLREDVDPDRQPPSREPQAWPKPAEDPPVRARFGSLDDFGRSRPAEPVQEAPVRPASYETSEKFREVMREARIRLEQGELAETHLLLSRFYGSPGLTPDQETELAELLDYLAGKVIYSRQHILERPYTVPEGDTLTRIAAQYSVSPQLLAKINGIRDPEQRLEPGTQLKVIRGPFDAVIYPDRFELVLMLGGYYAGRFPIGLGRDVQGLAPSYLVRQKKLIPASSYPRQPLDRQSASAGDYVIFLDERVAIHAVEDPRFLRTNEGQGSIGLGPRDIEDIFDILTAQADSPDAVSKITVRQDRRSVADGAAAPGRRF